MNVRKVSIVSAAVAAVMSAAAVVLAVTTSKEVGTIEIQGPNGLPHTIYIDGHVIVPSYILARYDWRCTGEYDRETKAFRTVCQNGSKRYDHTIDCRVRHTKSYYHIETRYGQLTVTSGCGTETWSD